VLGLSSAYDDRVLIGTMAMAHDGYGGCLHLNRALDDHGSQYAPFQMAMVIGSFPRFQDVGVGACS